MVGLSKPRCTSTGSVGLCVVGYKKMSLTTFFNLIEHVALWIDEADCDAV